MCTAVLAVQIDRKVGHGDLLAMRHDLLTDDQRRTVCKLCAGHADCGVHAAQLSRFHFHIATLGNLDLGGGIEHALTRSLALAVVLFHVFELGVLANVEAVNTVVRGFLVAGIVNTTACHDEHVGVLTDIKIVIYKILQSRLGQQHGNIHALVLGAGLDDDIDTGLVRLGHDINVGGGVSCGTLTVGTDVIRALGHDLQIHDLGEKIFLNGGHALSHYTSPPTITLQGFCVPNRSGKISSLVPCAVT